MDNLVETFQKCWNLLVDRYRLRTKEFAFFSESDIHRALADLLETENVGSVHLEFPLPIDPTQFWGQIEKFGKVTFRKGYYSADVCILSERAPKLITEIRWIPALIPPFQFLNNKDEKVKLAREKLEEYRKKYRKAMPQKHVRRHLRNLGKFLTVLDSYHQDYELEGCFCVIDELCPTVDQQLKKEIQAYDTPDYFHLFADYID